MSTIRPSAKAVIVENDQLLLTRNYKPDEEEQEFWLLPGGGQDHQESLAATLIREVKEETGFDIEVGDIIWVRDYIGANHELADVSPRLRDEHALELMFGCRVVGGVLGDGHEHDPGQIEAVWVPIGQLAGLRVFPSALAQLIPAFVAGHIDGPVYLGDIN